MAYRVNRLLFEGSGAVETVQVDAAALDNHQLNATVLKSTDQDHLKCPDVDAPSEDYLLNFESNEDKFDCFKSRGLHFFHINAQSLIPKLSELKILASKTRASIIAISEHGLMIQSRTQKLNSKVLMLFAMIVQEMEGAFVYTLRMI